VAVYNWHGNQLIIPRVRVQIQLPLMLGEHLGKIEMRLRLHFWFSFSIDQVQNQLPVALEQSTYYTKFKASILIAVTTGIRKK
jgi:hypothetical protein